MTYREWPSTCSCGFTGGIWGWSNKLPLECPQCLLPTTLVDESKPHVHSVIGDELINYEARHGVCWPDGRPRRYDSKTDLKRALNKAGLTIDGDSPKPYRV